jgi:hypothetical protein
MHTRTRTHAHTHKAAWWSYKPIRLVGYNLAVFSMHKLNSSKTTCNISLEDGENFKWRIFNTVLIRAGTFNFGC